MKTKIVLSLFLIISLLSPTINVSLGYSYKARNVIDSSWYEIENQPEEALNIVELWIGNKVYRVNGIERESDVSPVIKDGRTLVPIRVISEGLGASVSWDPVLRKVGIELETLEGIKRVELFISNNEYFINGESFSMDVPPQIINGRTLVPVRVVSESLDCKVYWNGVERKVTVKGINLSSDFDFDLLTFKDEYTYHTNPNDKDTDDDNLTDYEEVKEYKTNPLNPDTDGDRLKDNEEVVIYKTDPSKSDTDNDNLTDYEEIMEYNTDPLNPDTDGDRLKDNEEIDVGLDPLKDYSNPFSINIHDKDYVDIKKDIDRIINKDAFELFKSVVDKINGIEDEKERISVLGKFLEFLDVVQDDKDMIKGLGDEIEKRGIERIDEIKEILNKKREIHNLIDSFYKDRDEKLKENFFTFLYPKIEDKDTVLTYNRIESFFSFVSSLPDELKDYELETFLFFEDGKIDKEEEEFINSYIENKDDENNITLARKVIDSYFAKIPSDDPNKFDFIEELKNLPSYKEVTPEESINLLESYEDIIFLYLKGKPYEKFEDRFKEKEEKESIVIDGKLNDWKSLGLESVIQDPINDTHYDKEGCDIKNVYATIRDGYLYVAFETEGPINKESAYIFPIDTNMDEDWDYSIGFNQSKSWFYDLRDYENGKWPDKSQDITAFLSDFEINEVAEIKVPLFILNSPEHIQIWTWINSKVDYKWRTIDEAGPSRVVVKEEEERKSIEEKITKQHEVWEGFDLMLRGGDYRQLEGEKDFEIMRNYANQIKFDGKGDDWENYPFLQSDKEDDLNIMPPKGVEKDSVDIISYAFLRDDDYVYVFYKTKGKPAEDPNISWRFRVRLSDNQWCEIDEGYDRIYINRYDNNRNYGHYELTPKGKYLKVGDVVEYRIPLSKMWNFKDMKNIYFELWVRNLVSEKDIDMDTGYGKLGAIFTYKIPEFNTQLSLLYYLTTNTELKLFDTLSISDAISNGIFLTIGDDEVKRVSSKDSLDLLLYLREVNEWQKKVGIYPLEDLPLLEKMFLTFRIDSNWTNYKIRDRYDMSNFINKRMNIKVYKWLTTEISTLREMREFVEETIIPKPGTNTRSIGNTLDDYFYGSGFKEHWFYTLKYNEEKDQLVEYLPDMIIDGEKVNPHSFYNNDFIWKYFKEHGKGIGDCGDESSFIRVMLKSIGISSWTIHWFMPYKFKNKLTYRSHWHAIYFSPEENRWFSPLNQLEIDRITSKTEKITLISLTYTSDPSSFNIYNYFKKVILPWSESFIYPINTFEELKKKFYDEGMPESEMKRFIYDNLFPDCD